MGIPKSRFVGTNHEQFICSICVDVADDPVTISDCDHIFCRSCIGSAGLKKCPECMVPLKDSRTYEIKGTLKRIYNFLSIKCINPFCDKLLNPLNYKDHDLTCPVTFDNCKDCGLKFSKGPTSGHSCVQVLKAKLDEVETKMEERIKFERDRLEELIYFSIGFRDKLPVFVGNPWDYPTATFAGESLASKLYFRKCVETLDEAKKQMDAAKKLGESVYK